MIGRSSSASLIDSVVADAALSTEEPISARQLHATSMDTFTEFDTVSEGFDNSDQNPLQ